jgi:aryl-alcohol dehydrogenase-like predicted oxidoreductase
VAEASAIADAHSVSIPEVAIAWLLGTEGVTAPIIGPRTREQLEGLLGAGIGDPAVLNRMRTGL